MTLTFLPDWMFPKPGTQPSPSCGTEPTPETIRRAQAEKAARDLIEKGKWPPGGGCFGPWPLPHPPVTPPPPPPGWGFPPQRPFFCGTNGGGPGGPQGFCK